MTSIFRLVCGVYQNSRYNPRWYFPKHGPFIFHPVEHYDPFHPRIRPALNHTWFKTNGILNDDPLMHQNTLAYASDFNLLITALFTRFGFLHRSKRCQS
ncbi:MAG: hypothetical protein IPO48_19985 [Saprospiraceae bacterium]|nr:hypothetical protein [Saprospiraceae bacterium]